MACSPMNGVSTGPLPSLSPGLTMKGLAAVSTCFQRPLANAATGVRGQILFAEEDAPGRLVEVDALGCRAPWFQIAGDDVGALRVAMGRVRPEDREAVPARDKEQTLANGRGAIVAGAQFPPIDLITMLAKLPHEALERDAFLLGIGFGITLFIDNHRTPCCEFDNIFQGKYSWFAACNPAHSDPGKATDFLRDRCAALSFREVLAVWREPHQGHWSTLGYFPRIHIPHAFAQVQRVRMVHCVHRDRFRIVVDGDVNRSPERCFQAGTCPAPARKVVNKQFVTKIKAARVWVTHRCHRTVQEGQWQISFHSLSGFLAKFAIATVASSSCLRSATTLIPMRRLAFNAFFCTLSSVRAP